MRTLTITATLALLVADASAKPHEFESVVLVGDADRFFCSGVVVAPRLVLTAAHCRGATRIAIGSSVDSAITIRVTETVVHPDEDIAVMTLETATSMKRYPVRRSHEAPFAEIAIVGFGVRDPVLVTGFGKIRVRRITATGWGCDVRRSAELGCRVDRELLLRGGRDNDTCFGDSGGGAFERTSKGWRLIGITSRGTSPKRVVCGEGGVYVRTDRVTDWLTSQGVVE